MLFRLSYFCYHIPKGGARDGNKRHYFRTPQKRGLSQDELATKVMVTRQAVSRWENGETISNMETLKLLSKEFNVSINKLLGEPR